jgi:hypothetical protein
VSSRTFGHHKLHNRLVLSSRKDWALAVITIIVFYLFALYLFSLPNTPENPFASIYSESLIKTTCQHLLLLVGFDTLIYRKYYDTPPILVGHQAPQTLTLGFQAHGTLGLIKGRWPAPKWAPLREGSNKVGCHYLSNK